MMLQMIMTTNDDEQTCSNIDDDDEEYINTDDDDDKIPVSTYDADRAGGAGDFGWNYHHYYYPKRCNLKNPLLINNNNIKKIFGSFYVI